MIPTCSTAVTKKLAFRYILENIDYRKRCMHLQQIILLGKLNNVWSKALNLYFDIPFKSIPYQKFNRN